MGRRRTATAVVTRVDLDPVVVCFAELMQGRYGAEIYAFGSRGRGTARADSDYDLVAVSPSFAEQRSFLRVPDRYDLWQQAGGYGLGLDLHCYTPDEFDEEVEGLGYLGEARERGELIRIQLDPQEPCALRKRLSV